MPPVVTSRANPQVKDIRALRMRKYRERGAHFWIEGIRIVHEALMTGASIERLVYAPELLDSEHGRSLIGKLPSDRQLPVSSQVFHSLSQREGPQGLGAVVRMVDRPLSDIAVETDLLVVVAHQIQDPGNLGTIIRTADCAGASGVVIIGPAADPYDARSVRASMGSLFALPLVRLPGDVPLWQWAWEAQASGWPLQTVATSAHASQDYRAPDYRRPTILLVGSEGSGLPDELSAQADDLVRIPLLGRASSLNVAAAAAVLLYEVLNQRSEGWRISAKP
jgi:TrmH family RNA methyltransferase